MKAKIKLLDSKAKIPTKAHETDTGFDITMIGVEKIVGDAIFFKTGIAITPPSGYYFEIVPRSSISKLPLEMANSFAVIDESYTGQLLIPIRITHPGMGQDLKNTSFPSGIVKIFGSRPSTMNAVGDLILKEAPSLFQLILRKKFEIEFEEVDSLEETKRGEGGFGSTNKKKD